MTPQQNYLQVQLALLQHHLDDARVYGSTGHRDAAGLSLDDAEEGVEQVGSKTLPPEAQQQIEQVAQQGDHEAAEAGVPASNHEQAEKIACFQLGMDVLCRQLGLVGARRELFRKVASQVALERVKTAADALACVGEFGAVKQAMQPLAPVAPLAPIGQGAKPGTSTPPAHTANKKLLKTMPGSDKPGSPNLGLG